MHASVVCDQGSVLDKDFMVEGLILTEKQMKLKACG
jgi:hypothetical protein